MAGPRASSGQLRSRIRRQSSSTTPTSGSPNGNPPPGPVPKERLESLKEDVVMGHGSSTNQSTVKATA